MENFIIFFKDDSCEPCLETLPHVEALNQENETRKFFIVDVKEAPKMIKDFALDCVPTFIFIKNEEEVRRETGSASRNRLEGFLRYLEH
jgi:thiol-disulfide isomerase/thioredoxin